ncbi:MAG TPA: hydrogenase formation protein HypD [Steroidobacteraceae bacterium]|nr:hydrogenase formation protein HypD [Steroidobacteraceae bacterium]
MRYIDEFRDGRLARGLAAAIRRDVAPSRLYRFMEFCGGHTHAISRYGLADLLPENVRMVHGPGCPVCVLPIGRIDQAIRLAIGRGVILTTYGDTLRVPASEGLSLLRAKALGADVRMVYSTQDALAIARANPRREVVFLAIGFETTTPPTAVAILTAAAERLGNFSILCDHVLTPAAMHAILAAPQGVQIDGFVGPAHVSTVIGSAPYEPFADDYAKPVVIAGFEPLDLLRAIHLLVAQVNDGRAAVENEFTRAVTREGNRRAQDLVARVFTLREKFEWRGLGTIPSSALRLRPEFAQFDAERRFAERYLVVADHKACACGPILRGEKRPSDCKLFGTVCTPENPVGSCMVSAEGACAAHYTYGRFRGMAA